jgi:chemotaxis protein MotB
MKKNKSENVYIRRRRITPPHQFHGGSWKLAYADFVTALMAFFLLLWLLSASPNKKLETIAQYFVPTLSFLQKDVKTKDNDYQYNSKIGIQYGAERVGNVIDIQQDGEKINVDEMNNKIFLKIESDIDSMLEKSQDINKSVSYKNTVSGLEITISDQANNPLFEVGSAKLTDYAKNMLTKIIKYIKYSPNLIQISGYTDKSNQNALTQYGNWELSFDRADSARRYFLMNTISYERIHSLVARADTELIDQNNPYSPVNRRITITLLRNSGIENYKISTPKN